MVGRGIRTGGFITARLETHKYAFRNSIHGVRLKGLEPWQEATLIAIFWSALARYFYFTTSGSWGFWHDEIHLEDVEAMPICFPKDGGLRNRIVSLVDNLQQLDTDALNFGLFRRSAANNQQKLETALDTAIFDLYELTAADRDLIREQCTIGLDLFYKHRDSHALRHVIPPSQSFGTLSDIAGNDDDLTAYLRTFIEVWNAEPRRTASYPGAFCRLRPVRRCSPYALPRGTKTRSPPPLRRMITPWLGLRSWRRLQEHSLVHAGAASIFIDTFFRYVGDRQILFIKRNERRFWTPSTAREDAESTLTHLMNGDDGVFGGDA